MFGDVDQQLRLEELLQNVLGRHVDERLFGRGRHAALHHHAGAMNVFLLHAGAIGLDSLDADFRLIGKEDEHLVGWIIVVSDQHDEIRAGRTFLAEISKQARYRQEVRLQLEFSQLPGLVAELFFKLF